MSNDIVLKFVFAGHDGLFVEQTVDKSSTVQNLKQKLLEVWPEGVQSAEDPKCIRLICMGNAISADSKTLEDLKVPKYEFPTPINVSLKPIELIHKDVQVVKTRWCSSVCCIS
mmetsp:Transcript_1040/g.1342  ORF Transcript_1040/g.1342 Transcript_1040/m.1342 type:complete len:113 (+) Transcript_1040:101-439(+)